jgi:hypothetical protein
LEAADEGENMINKKTAVMCPSCEQPIYNKNRKAMLLKCKKCKRVMCSNCEIENYCMDCYIAHYNAEDMPSEVTA